MQRKTSSPFAISVTKERTCDSPVAHGAEISHYLSRCGRGPHQYSHSILLSLSFETRCYLDRFFGLSVTATLT